ncbi:restriction endonuclease subunit S [Escherichia coli]|uniref:restriction endonuclease subunit S n=3 Tax=Escherichia coli TaxID=562 RepID=UPI000CF0AA2C|nr:restriction endonuclease subunit S [Escherichia coli]EMB1320027.1 restriction endonuclease subunit S [Escherichia coli]EME1584532.1 restriction endonuclease subunit S [Escherichia coli]MCA8711222.1 restriction endonuclease subunit S [Escherichia coli]MDY8501739.1 restriction endonuclease subunit S [Escherichia coli]MDY8518460.1 restriction endonuclease subunit S [Escherichia coli]
MSELSYLEKLLDGVEVEWKTLKDVCDFKNGFAFKSSLFKETGLPIVRITNIDGFNVDLDEVKYFSLNDYKEDLSSFEVSMGNILIAMSGATTGKVGIYKKGIKCYLNQRVGKFIPKENILNNNYLYHFLLLNTETIYILAGGGAQPNLSSNALMSKLLIPIPCPGNPEKSLAIQSEIVRILDKFTELTAELTAELTMRKKQYNYYRDQLLSFKEGEVEWKTLGEIGEFIRGKRFTKADYVEDGGISVIHYGEIYTRYGVYTTHSLSQVRADMAASLRYAKHGDVVITDVGETVEDVGKAVAWLGDDDIAIHDHCYAFRHSLNPKFISYYMQTDSFISEKAKYVARTKVNTLLINGFSKIMIPVPYPKDHEKSLKEQARIVAILDKFDTLTNSITEGLPREIELRQKQYEYYRDLLFSFPKPETISN